MAKKKTDTQVSKEKTKKARQTNAEKQKRYRESMKAQGYRARLVWEKPLCAGQIRAAATVIRETSLSIVRSNPAVGEVLENLCETFKMDCEKKRIQKEVWNPLYRDIQVLLKPFLDEIKRVTKEPTTDTFLVFDCTVVLRKPTWYNVEKDRYGYRTAKPAE
jgi:hypothetical protein